MAKRRLIWKLYPTYLLIIILCTGTVGAFALRSVKSFYLSHTARALEARASLVRQQVARLSDEATAEELDALAKTLGRVASTRVTIIKASGEVLGDSEENPRRMDDHADRPEVKQALGGKVGQAIRHSYTLGQDMMYIALPLLEGPRAVGVVRTSIPLTEIDQALASIYRRIAVSALVVAAIAAGLGLVVSRWISLPLAEMKRGAGRFAGGDFGQKLLIPDTEEIGGLAEALNRMAAELEEKIGTLARQKGEQEAVLSSMAEGVLAVDAEERIISLNNTAATLIGVGQSSVQGRSLQEVVRNVDLQRFVAKVLGGIEPIDGEITISDETDRFLQAHGTVLRDAQGREIGALVVLNDVTRLRHLEAVRRDFVANVSHELKTPITSINGFVETLRDGAIADRDKAEHFLAIIGKQTDRLNAIIEDLLSLSRIEQDVERSEIELAEARIREVLEAAVHDCESTASERDIRISLLCEDDVVAQINPPLLEQAVANLIGNAIKFSEPGREVEVEAVRTSGEVVISVRDWGCGIDKEHLPRLFERFYRVDKARSRKLGGTGLGLAIVKHIAHALGGNVTVVSTPGQGSVFSIHLPRARA